SIPSESSFVTKTRVVKSRSRADVYILFMRASGVSGPSVFNSPRHQALSKKCTRSSGEVGGCISRDQQSVTFSIGSLSLQIGSIPPPLGAPARKADAESRCGAGLVRLQTLSASIELYHLPRSARIVVRPAGVSVRNSAQLCISCRRLSNRSPRR